MAKKNETLVSVIALAVGAWLLGNKMKKTNESIGRTWFGGNSGYDGYSMSWRARQARYDGKYPKTDFKRVYGLTDKSFNALVHLGIIEDSEWHHTSKYGNRTTFYAWYDEEDIDIYQKNKKTIDKYARDGDYDLIRELFGLETEVSENNKNRIIELEEFLNETIKSQIPLTKIDTILGKMDAYHASNGLFLEPIHNAVMMVDPDNIRVYANGKPMFDEPELSTELFVDGWNSYWWRNNRDEVIKAQSELASITKEAIAPYQELYDELRYLQDEADLKRKIEFGL